MKNLMFAVFAVMVAGCSAFAGLPEEEVPMMMSDAGAMPATDGGSALPIDASSVQTDGGGLIEMPREIDAGVGVDQPLSGEECDPDRDRDLEPPPCGLDGCDSAYLICTHASVWRCVPAPGAICMPVPATDAGTDAGRAELDAGSPAVDAGHDAGTDAGRRDAGSDAGARDAGRAVLDAGPPADRCERGSFVGCWLAPLCPGVIPCDPAAGYFGACVPFLGYECPSIVDAGTPDAGTDAGRAELDAGPRDAGSDAGPAPTPDAGSSYTATDYLRVRIGAATTLLDLSAWCPDGGTPDIRLHNGRVWRTSRRGTTLDIPMSELTPGPYNSTVFCQLDTTDPTAASPEPSWNGYASPIVTSAALGTPVSTMRFLEVSIGGRPALANTFYCHDTWTRGIRRVQVQVVDPSIALLPRSCSGSTGTP